MSSSIIVTIEGDPSTITLRPEVVDLLKAVSASHGDTSLAVAEFIASELNEVLIAKTKQQIDETAGPIVDSDIQP